MSFASSSSISSSSSKSTAPKHLNQRALESARAVAKKRELFPDENMKCLGLFAKRNVYHEKVNAISADIIYMVLRLLDAQDLAYFASTSKAAWNLVHNTKSWQEKAGIENLQSYLSSHGLLFFISSIDKVEQTLRSYNDKLKTGALDERESLKLKEAIAETETRLKALQAKKTPYFKPTSQQLTVHGIRPAAFALASNGLAASSHEPLREHPGRLEELARHDITLWDSRTEKRVTTFRGHTGNVGLIAFAEDLHVLISAASDGTMRLWKTNGNYECLHSQPVTEPIYSLCYAGGGLLFTGHNGAIQAWQFDKPFKKLEILSSGLHGPVTSLRTLSHPNGTLFVAASTKHAINDNLQLWVHAPEGGKFTRIPHKLTFNPIMDVCMRFEVDDAHQSIPTLFVLSLDSYVPFFSILRYSQESLVSVRDTPIQLPHEPHYLSLYGNLLAFSGYTEFNRGKVFFLPLPKSSLEFRDMEFLGKRCTFINPPHICLPGDFALEQRSLRPAIRHVAFLPDTILLTSPNATTITRLQYPKI